MALPPGPQTPGIWQMLHWIMRPFSFMRGCAKTYGDCFTVKLGDNYAPMVFVHHPQALQTILTNDEGRGFEAPGSVNGLFVPFLGTQSLLALGGDRHRRMRQLMMPPFHGERMRSYAHLMAEVTDQVIADWKQDKSFSLRESMQAISMRVILQAVFGLAEGERYQQLEKLLGAMLDDMSHPLSVTLLYFPILRQDWGAWSPWGNFVRIREQADRIIYREIAERRANPNDDRTDILSLLLASRDETGQGLTDGELHDELMTLLVAGHETTATALTWALYWIHKDPQIREKLLQELQNLEDFSDLNTLLRLPYLNAVCSETLRIYPVGMLTFPRLVQEPVEISGYVLEPGTLLAGSIYLTHHREDLYPDSDTFRPERFLDRQFSPFEFIPFGGGSRRCLGMAFAQFEMKVVLSRILSQVELALAGRIKAHPIRRGLTSGSPRITMRVTGESSILTDRQAAPKTKSVMSQAAL